MLDDRLVDVRKDFDLVVGLGVVLVMPSLQLLKECGNVSLLWNGLERK